MVQCRVARAARRCSSGRGRWRNVDVHLRGQVQERVQWQGQRLGQDFRHQRAGVRAPGRITTLGNQKISFNPNWIWREVVVVAVINPAVGLMAPFEKTVALGVPRLVWFSTLKTSARNCRWDRSVIAVSLNSEASTSAKPG